MKTPNEQIKELIEKIHEETGETVDNINIEWIGNIAGESRIVGVSVRINSKG